MSDTQQFPPEAMMAEIRELNKRWAHTGWYASPYQYAIDGVPEQTDTVPPPQVEEDEE